MPNWLKTKADEAKWEKAKGLAEKQGQKENWAYVMGIFRSMKPDHKFQEKTGARINPPQYVRKKIEAQAQVKALPPAHRDLVVRAVKDAKLWVSPRQKTVWDDDEQLGSTAFTAFRELVRAKWLRSAQQSPDPDSLHRAFITDEAEKVFRKLGDRVPSDKWRAAALADRWFESRQAGQGPLPPYKPITGHRGPCHIDHPGQEHQAFLADLNATAKASYDARNKWAYMEGKKDRVAGAQVILGHVLAHLRAMHWNYWTSHWQARGASSYGDHQLYERLYEGTVPEIDTLAEKLVGYFGVEAVDVGKVAVQSAYLLKTWEEREADLHARALHTENEFQAICKDAHAAIKVLGSMTLGLDDFLMSLASAHETNQYLIQQRLSTVKLARRVLMAAKKKKVPDVEEARLKADWHEAEAKKYERRARMNSGGPDHKAQIAHLTAGRLWRQIHDPVTHEPIPRVYPKALKATAAAEKADQVAAENRAAIERIKMKFQNRAAAEKTYLVSLFSDKPGAKALWTEEFKAKDAKDADNKAVKLVRTVLKKYEDAEDWVVEEVKGKKAAIARIADRHLAPN